jgi:hypothetical protein
MFAQIGSCESFMLGNALKKLKAMVKSIGRIEGQIGLLLQDQWPDRSNPAGTPIRQVIQAKELAQALALKATVVARDALNLASRLEALAKTLQPGTTSKKLH